MLFTQSQGKLTEIGIDSSVIDDIPVDSVMTDFSSSDRRYDYYRNKLPYVQPVQVELGMDKKLKHGVLVDTPAIGYAIPFKETIRRLLEITEVWDEIALPHNSNSDFMVDICDGNYIQKHPLFVRNPCALQIVVNTDDLEITNPLGSHTKKHKITMFYFSVANIRPAFRSQLHVIQLLAIAKTNTLRKHGAEGILLNDFMSSINAMSNGGLRMFLHGEWRNIEGALVCVAADTLAANWFGKFKEGVSFAMRGCRQCECRGRDARMVMLSRQSRKRSLSEHRERCLHLSTLSSGSRAYWSKVWGINGTSCLLSLDFPLTSGLVQDPMHILLEGVVPYEMSLMLYKVIVVYRLCSEPQLNALIASFPYSYLHRSSKPEPIEKGSVENVVTVKQTAAAMLTLCYILPLIVGPMIPEQHDILPFWRNWLRLLCVVLLSTSTYCKPQTAALMCIIIADYLQNFELLYPRASFLPKMHFMIHLPDQMLDYGPLRHQWCMRFEGKNGFFKQKKWKNFRNVPYSLAKYHQLHMLHKQVGSNIERNQNFLYAGDIVAKGKTVVVSTVYPNLMTICSVSFQMILSQHMKHSQSLFMVVSTLLAVLWF